MLLLSEATGCQIKGPVGGVDTSLWVDDQRCPVEPPSQIIQTIATVLGYLLEETGGKQWNTKCKLAALMIMWNQHLLFRKWFKNNSTHGTIN